MKIPEQVRLIEELEGWRHVLHLIIREGAPGDPKAVRDVIASLKKELRRLGFDAPDMWGDNEEDISDGSVQS